MWSLDEGLDRHTSNLFLPGTTPSLLDMAPLYDMTLFFSFHDLIEAESFTAGSPSKLLVDQETMFYLRHYLIVEQSKYIIFNAPRS